MWVRALVFAMSTGHDGQLERFYLVQVGSFDPRPAFSVEELLAEGITDVRCWTPEELERSDGVFAPRRLPELLATLLVNGPPETPLDVGGLTL